MSYCSLCTGGRRDYHSNRVMMSINTLQCIIVSQTRRLIGWR